MGAWKGIWMGMQAAEESKRNAAEQERLERSLALTEERFNFDKRTQLINTALSLSDRMGLSTKVTGEDKANLQLLAKKVSGVEGADEWLAGFNKNPALATQVLELIKKKDITGEKLMTLINVHDLAGSEQVVQKYTTTGDILAALTGDTEIDDLIAEISTGTPPTPVLDIDPSLYDKTGDDYDTDKFNYFDKQARAFNAAVIRKAKARMQEDAVKSNPDLFAQYNEAIKNSSLDQLDPFLRQTVAPLEYQKFLTESQQDGYGAGQTWYNIGLNDYLSIYQ